ncbi:MAG: peptide deformylase [Rhodospirillaceae bacterium]|nr:peptide deformylase [Rhodospirillaceae bacterium]
MPARKLIYGPHPVFRQKAEPITDVDEDVRDLIADMFDTLYDERGVGIGANMIGILRRVIVVDLQDGGVRAPLALINPEVLECSEETQTITEASLSFPGISAEITRPKTIKVTYLDQTGTPRVLEADGYLATVIQHEMDYLDGRIFLDHLSRLKRESLLRKAEKYRARIGLQNSTRL